jgi:hypothetical protein
LASFSMRLLLIKTLQFSYSVLNIRV